MKGGVACASNGVLVVPWLLARPTLGPALPLIPASRLGMVLGAGIQVSRIRSRKHDNFIIATNNFVKLTPVWMESVVWNLKVPSFWYNCVTPVFHVCLVVQLASRMVLPKNPTAVFDIGLKGDNTFRYKWLRVKMHFANCIHCLKSENWILLGGRSVLSIVSIRQKLHGRNLWTRPRSYKWSLLWKGDGCCCNFSLLFLRHET